MLLKSPADWGADVAVGSTQRFGIPLGFGGPHAAYFATKDEFKRSIPGRIIGVSVDKNGQKALRMALQTREQHIKRERATSNICTAQALLANMAGFYAVYHGPEGLKRIADNVHGHAKNLHKKLTDLGFESHHASFFDTIKITVDPQQIKPIAEDKQINFRYFADSVGISLDQTTREKDLEEIVEVFKQITPPNASSPSSASIPEKLYRKDKVLQQEVFNKYRSETEMMRYLKYLENKDISLCNSMISLGSCTMKLNAATQLMPLSYPEFAHIHPYAPANQWKGYGEMIEGLSQWLCGITGLDAVSFQPNSGAQGEYAGLLAIRSYHIAAGEKDRNIALIPSSAHGTNPASAVMAGMKVVVVKCDISGNIDLDDLNQKISQYGNEIACLMITYPSTHGVFEEDIIEITENVHNIGGLVYMDGANMNAQVGITSPKAIGADVCHLNLHKTFAIPHGGGGPGMGPIAVTETLKSYLPSNPVEDSNLKEGNAISAAHYGSASILLISHAYIQLLGKEGLLKSTEAAIQNANYLAAQLKNDYQILYKGKNGFVAHEMILDCRHFKKFAGVTVEDIAKRLIDFGYHAPTVSFPVAGTLMVEPTESESKGELDRFIEVMKTIRAEIEEITNGSQELKKTNVLKKAPHIAVELVEDWDRPYSKKQAFYPLEWLKYHKYWCPVGRIDNAFGDRNLICTCASIESYSQQVNEPEAV